MKILSFDKFIEKFKIDAININDLSDVNASNSLDMNNPDSDWYERMRGKHLKSSYVDMILALRKTGHHCDLNKLYKAAQDTNDRFKSWLKLDKSELMKKHEQRANKTMTPEKHIACYYVALEWYGPVVSNNKEEENRKIIEYYHKMLINEGFDDEQLYNIFIN